MRAWCRRWRCCGDDGGKFEREAAAFADFAFDADPAAVLFENLLAHRQAQAGAAAAFARDEDGEDLFEVVLLDAAAVVDDLRRGPSARRGCIASRPRRGRRSRSWQASMALVTTLRTARCIDFGVEHQRRHRRRRQPDELDVRLLGRAVFISSTTSAASSLRFAGSGTGSRSLLNVSMSITSVEIRS